MPLAIGAAAVCGCTFFPALGFERRARAGILLGLSIPILLTPLVIPPGARFVRWVSAIFAVLLVVKLLDLHIDAGRGRRPSARTFAAFLFNPASFVLRRLPDEPRPSTAKNLARFLLGTVGYVAATIALVRLFRVDWDRYPFAIEHCIKVIVLVLSLTGLLIAFVAIWRLLGGTGRDFMGNFLSARTPAEFWRWYNRPVQQFFCEDVFRIAGSRRTPMRAALTVFALSALLHEYVFSIAIGRVQGYQTTYFLLQGMAVAATMHVKPTGRRAIPWIALTLAFNLTSSVLFFASFHEVMPFYSRGLPAWLP